VEIDHQHQAQIIYFHIPEDLHLLQQYFCLNFPDVFHTMKVESRREIPRTLIILINQLDLN
jgi:hypothetical protein